MARPRIEPTDASHRATLARWRVSNAKKHEPNLDPASPLRAVQARRRELERQRKRECTQRHLAKAAQVITCEWFEPIPPPPVPVFPEPIRRNVFQAPAMKPVRDWRQVLPMPEVWRPRPTPNPQPTPTLYGTRYRSGR